MMRSMHLCNARLIVSEVSLTLCGFYMYLIYVDTHVSIGGVVIDVFESAVGPLINSSLQLADRK